MPLGGITTDSMRTAFAQYAETHEAASIQRCWSTWNVLCTFLYTSELIAANPMPLVGRPKIAKTLPKALPTDSVAALLATLNADPQRRRRAATGSNVIAHSSSPRCWPGCAPMNCCAPTSVTFAVPTTALSSTFAARPARTDESR